MTKTAIPAMSSQLRTPVELPPQYFFAHSQNLRLVNNSPDLSYPSSIAYNPLIKIMWCILTFFSTPIQQ